MSIHRLCAMVVLTTLVAMITTWFGTHSEAQAAHFRRTDGRELFYNYYMGPASCAGGTSAQLYTAPMPTPPVVGHTYITYPPLMPHELLYRHHRHYYRHHPGGGWVNTKVYWW